MHITGEHHCFCCRGEQAHTRPNFIIMSAILSPFHHLSLAKLGLWMLLRQSLLHILIPVPGKDALLGYIADNCCCSSEQWQPT